MRSRPALVAALVLVLLLLAAALPLAAAAADGWSPQDSGTTQNLRGVSFVDADHGWAVGDGRFILSIRNGGTSWGKDLVEDDSALYGVSMPDATRGWAVGMRGTIMTTKSGTIKWYRQISRVSVPLFAVSFPDTTNGWVVGYGGKALGTSDGGLQWSSQRSGVHEHLLAVSFPDTVHGWAVGNRGTVIATTTGGWPAETCTVTPSVVGGHGSISPSTPQEYEAGATPTFSFTPEAGYYVSQVLVDGEPVTLTAPGSYTFAPLTGDQTISVSFTQGVCAVTALPVTAGGTVSPLGTTWVPFFGALTVDITPAAHYHTDRVTIDGAAVRVQPAYTFVNVSARHRLEAAFALDRYTVTPSVVRGADGRPHGSISPATTGTYVWGATPRFGFTPESGYAVFEVRVDGVQLLPTPRTSYTFAALTGAHTISVRFVKNYVPAVQ